MLLEIIPFSQSELLNIYNALAGAPPASAAVYDGPDIVVTGSRYGTTLVGGGSIYGSGSWDSGWFANNSNSPQLPPAAADDASRDVTVNLIPTAEQGQTIANFRTTISTLDALIARLPVDAVLNLPGIGRVTGAEVKALWAVTDFTINPIGTSYRNGTTLGQADFNGGNPQISFNIDTLSDYNRTIGGLNYVTLHDFAHLLPVAQSQLTSAFYDGVFSPQEINIREQLANDIARAIANTEFLDVLPRDGNSAPGYGYSTPAPLPFAPPPPPIHTTDAGDSSAAVGHLSTEYAAAEVLTHWTGGPIP